jgi:streptomycin 6-kinase
MFYTNTCSPVKTLSPCKSGYATRVPYARSMRLPAALETSWSHEPDWLAALPRLVAECADRWNLELEEPLDTPHSLVVPAGEAVLKLNARSHFEADHEADALSCWDGNGAVRLLARDDARRALLVERCRPGTRLWDAAVDELTVIPELVSRLSRVPGRPHPFRLLADEADRWLEELPHRYDLGGRPFERPLLDHALDVFRTVDRTTAALVNQDLHGGNVLRAEREPWLVIDPKPLVGERELDGVGVLRNAVWQGEPVRRYLDALAGLGLDRDRLRGWGVAHTLAWAWDDDAGEWSQPDLAAARAIRAAA